MSTIRNKRGALWSVLVVIAGTLAGLGALLVINPSVNSPQGADTTTHLLTPQQEEAAYQHSQEEMEQLQITIPATVPFESVPSTTTPTSTTTPLPVFVQDRNVVQLNATFGWVSAPGLERGDIPLKRADVAEAPDAGASALFGGNAAWFDGSALTANVAGDLVSTNNLGLPGDGGIVAIGGHRNGLSRTGPFGNLHLLQKGDPIVIVTQFNETTLEGAQIAHTRISTYEVTTPCPEGNQKPCTDDKYLLHELAQRSVSTETLFLFTCDRGSRIFVEATLVDTRWQ